LRPIFRLERYLNLGRLTQHLKYPSSAQQEEDEIDFDEISILATRFAGHPTCYGKYVTYVIHVFIIL